MQSKVEVEGIGAGADCGVCEMLRIGEGKDLYNGIAARMPRGDPSRR